MRLFTCVQGRSADQGGTSRFRPDPSRTALNETETKTGDPVEQVEAELFTDGGNDAVVRLAGRKFPGVLIQGDTLSSLRADVAELVELCSAGDLEEARHVASLLQVDLESRLQLYADALDAHGISRPF
ncbi:hypothetical protein ACFCXK_14010 [Streptomyces sp. NPDC056269]|uniref:DUF6959 family protein n=1 Tax=Streptomyces sp. NPDC056269 TaxID=3345768 RepID=UPI0035DC7B40